MNRKIEIRFSYQNTKRTLSLTFKLLGDTVKDMQNLTNTINNYRAFLHNCGQATFNPTSPIVFQTTTIQNSTTNTKPDEDYANNMIFFCKKSKWV